MSPERRWRRNRSPQCTMSSAWPSGSTRSTPAGALAPSRLQKQRTIGARRGWGGVSRSQLIVPLDTHLHRISLALGLTRRKQAGLRTAIEVTNAFRTLESNDPVRYDFALTRLGIRSDTDLDAFLKECSIGRAA